MYSDFKKQDWRSYGPSLPILLGFFRITHSSLDLMNQKKFSQIFNILE